MTSDVYQQCQDYELLLLDILTVTNPNGGVIQVNPATWNMWNLIFKQSGYTDADLARDGQEKEYGAFAYGCE